MKYALAVLLFVSGYLIGTKFSSTHIENTNKKILQKTVTSKEHALSPGISQSVQKKIVPTKLQDCTATNTKVPNKYLRTPNKQQNRKMQKLYGQLLRALQSDDFDKQNKLFEEMVSINPKHLYVFETKVMFLKQDGDFTEAHKVLKECVAKVPDSVNCNMQLANIRTSSPEEKKTYAKKCLELKPNHPQCLLDLAQYYELAGIPQKALPLFKIIVNQHMQSYFRNTKPYIYWSYAKILENIDELDEALDNYSKACDFKHKQACKKIEDFGHTRQAS